MSGELDKRLQQLRLAYKSGLLDEDTYRAAIAGVEAAAGSGSAGDGDALVIDGERNIGGDVGGDVDMSDRHTEQRGKYNVKVDSAQGITIGDTYVGDPPQDKADKLSIYRQVYASACRNLPLRGVDVGESDPQRGGKRLALDQVYIDLNTVTQVGEKWMRSALGQGDGDLVKFTRKRQHIIDRIEVGLQGEREEDFTPLPALSATQFCRHLVLLGDPGSGKSTFLNFLGFCLAMQGLHPQQEWMNKLPGWADAEAELLPISVTLRDYAKSIGANDKATPHHVWRFIERQLGAQNLEFMAKLLKDALDQGQAIVLFDGLDEIPTREQRTFVRDAVAAFTVRYTKCRMVVTCRTLSYQDRDWQLQGLPAFELAEFDDSKINNFIAAWYTELHRIGVVSAEQRLTLTEHLKAAIQRKDLRRLAGNPLLLTVMALVHTHKGRLPDARAMLYEDTVEILLWRWDQIRFAGDEESPRIRQLLLDAGRTKVDLKKVLWELAYEAHSSADSDDGEALADISEWQLQRALATLHPQESLVWAREIVEVVKLRAGLLLERAPAVYTFPHRTFQEYLAGCYLSTQADFGRQATLLLKEGAFWREVILLAVGRLVAQGDTAKPLTLVGELCPRRLPQEELAWRKVWLAGEVLKEMGLNRVKDSELGQDLLQRVQQRLAKLLQAGALTAVERASAGDVLAHLGDPRFRTDAWYLPDECLLGFVEIPAGAFSMGSDTITDDERPQHQVDLPTFYIARYPVTVAQYQAFVDATGFEPGDGDALRDAASRPVRDVNWYEALAYCDWLTDALTEWSQTPEPLARRLHKGWRFTLPSEAQWEKAARGGDGRTYPWGEDRDPDKANYHATAIGTTSAVGCFPTGMSPYGVEDMSGNVWEWCLSKYKKYPYKNDKRNLIDKSKGRRVLRGGSFDDLDWFVRCAFRDLRRPHFRDLSVGFRV
ncbi:MAG: SUMF1/EgtB/PvdO family nonheme iron enzyme, partial [Halieaceae bacterium]|nr:SUMF1/EgtB/PvdO family nonheme iron enzyme [Halieaceae bacterium]